MRKSVVVLALALNISAGANAFAADGQGQFALHGVGALSCKDLGDQFKSDKNEGNIAASWLMGYMSAINRLQADTFDLSPVDDAGAMLRMVANFCQKYPNERVENIANLVFKTLSTARVKTNTPMVATKSGKNVAQVRVEVLKIMQARLTQLGYFKGKQDGTYGADSEAAVKTFQRAQKLPETGVADPPTIIRLLIELNKPVAAAPAKK